jgi:hypothetical protein
MSRSSLTLFRILPLAVEGGPALTEIWVAAAAAAAAVGGLPRLPRRRGHSVPLDVLTDRMCRGCRQVRESRVRVCDLGRISFPLTVTLRPQARLGLGCGVAALPKVVLARYRSRDWALLECSQCAASVRNREMGTS